MTDKDRELCRKALELKEHCASMENCTGCVFNSTGRPNKCDIAFSHFNGEIAAEPRDWEVCTAL